MKSAILKGAQMVLAAVAVCLLAVLITPRAEPALAKEPVTSAPAPSANLAPEHGKPDQAAPQAIVAIFVRRSSPVEGLTVAPNAHVPEVKKPVDAPWLSYIGFYSGAPGKPYYLFKDTRAGRVIQVSQTGVSNGWSLVEVSDKRLIVQYKDDVYIVNKR
jgi:hypothetical protein